MIISTLEKNYLLVPYEWTDTFAQRTPTQKNISGLFESFDLDLGRLKRTSFSAFLCFSGYYAKDNRILQYFSKYFICEFLYLLFLLLIYIVLP